MSGSFTHVIAGKGDSAGSSIKRVVQTLMQEDGLPKLSCVLGLQAERRSLMFADTDQLLNKELVRLLLKLNKGAIYLPVMFLLGKQESDKRRRIDRKG